MLTELKEKWPSKETNEITEASNRRKLRQNVGTKLGIRRPRRCGHSLLSDMLERAGTTQARDSTPKFVCVDAGKSIGEEIIAVIIITVFATFRIVSVAVLFLVNRRGSIVVS